jgi:hypothetical protein
MNDKSQLLALTLLTAAETAHSFSAFLPSYFTIRTFALDGDPVSVERKLKNLRSGYLPSVTFGLVLGSVVAFIAKHPLPLVAAAVTSAFMVWQYERAIPAEYRLVLPASSCPNGQVRQYGLV